MNNSCVLSIHLFPTLPNIHSCYGQLIQQQPWAETQDWNLSWGRQHTWAEKADQRLKMWSRQLQSSYAQLFIHTREETEISSYLLDQSINTWADIGNVKGSWDEIAKENDTSAEQVKEKPFVIDLDLRGYFWGQGWAGTLCWWGSMWCFHRNWRCQCRWPGFGQKMVKNTDEQSWFAKSHLIYWEDTAGNSSKNVTNKFKSSIEASLCCKRYTWYCLKDLLRIESLYAMTMPTMLTWMKTKRSSSMILRAKKRETKKELHSETKACSALKMMSPMK